MDKPSILIYDGACGICREWVDYWRCISGPGVKYQPYQEVAEDHPDISQQEFEAAVQLVAADGSRYRGARACLELYRNKALYVLFIRLYKYLPGFALISESCYNFLSRHRGLLAFFTHLFWGRGFRPAEFHLTTWVFLRLLGLIYCSAFLSLYVQITGLIGTDGILPLANYLDAARNTLGNAAYYRMPMIFWLHCSNGFLQFVCLAGAVLSLFVVFNFLSRTALLVMYILYLSLVYGGQQFMSFQWDMLLLEAGFLALFLYRGSHITIWLYRWLVFRFMFLGGMVKILSHDPTWRNLTALHFHFETQPLPSPLAWYAHHLPDFLLNSAVAATLLIEIVIPFLIFTPRRFRMFAACCIIVFQSCIILTGNYNFFNLLTITLCLFLFDDAALQNLLPSFLIKRITAVTIPPVKKTATVLLSLFAALVIYSSSEQLILVLRQDNSHEPSVLTRWLAPLQIINNYGPFAVMTTLRYEIQIEGSYDKQHWLAYEFKYKPDDPGKALSWNIPHQPRLDWQMWFAALSSPDSNIWFQNLLLRLLQNKKDVTGLFAHNPFPERAPTFIRARFYEYHFTTPQERETSGNIWQRQLVAEYYPVVSLKTNSR